MCALRYLSFPNLDFYIYTTYTKAVFSATLEIVMSSFNSQRNFPWILGTFQLEAYQFYKVIKIIIRADDGLARDMVKHLQVG